MNASVTSPVPADIDASKHMFDAFGNNETEVSAGYIVRLCQRKGNWTSFTEEEIEAFYQEAGHRDFWFNNLISGGWIVKEDGCYLVTPEFIGRCYRSSPAKS